MLLLELLVVLVLAEFGGFRARVRGVGGVVGGFLGGGSMVRLVFDVRPLRMARTIYPEDMLMALSDLLLRNGEVVAAVACLFAKWEVGKVWLICFKSDETLLLWFTLPRTGLHREPRISNREPTYFGH